MKPGHAAFAKAAAKQPKHPGLAQEVGGGVLAADAAASAPVLHAGRKTPTSMIGASPKVRARRYQGELTEAMREGKVPQDSTLRVFKTPSGRYINAGGTHRHLARQAMGVPTKKIEVKPMGYEPRFSLKAKVVSQHKINQLKRGSRDAVAGKVKPVGPKARGVNRILADSADMNDDRIWEHASAMAHKPTAIKAAEHGAKVQTAAAGLVGLGLIGAGIKNHRDAKQKVRKTVDGHDGFEISKRKHARANRDVSVGRVVTGALFPGFHGAIAGKKGHKLKAVGYEMGGSILGGGVGAPTIGAGVGTYAAAKQKHYKKLSSAGGFSKAAPRAAEKKTTQNPVPPEVRAYIDAKKAEIGKSASGHDAFLEDVEKAFSLGGAMDAVKGVGAIGRGLVKQPGILKPGAGAHRGVGQVAQLGGKVGGLVRKNPMKAAGIAGGAGLGAGYMAGRN